MEFWWPSFWTDMNLFSEVILQVLGQKNEEAVQQMCEYQFSCAPMDDHVDLPLLKENNGKENKVLMG